MRFPFIGQDKRVKRVVKVGPLKDHDRELLECPSIADQFPIVFESGVELINYEGRCARCGNSLPAEILTGKINRSFKGVAIIEAVGLCSACNLITRYKARIREDMSVQSIDDKGRWINQHFVADSLLERLKDWVKTKKYKSITMDKIILACAAVYLMLIALEVVSRWSGR